jgi:hypothetical protein
MSAKHETDTPEPIDVELALKLSEYCHVTMPRCEHDIGLRLAEIVANHNGDLEHENAALTAENARLENLTASGVHSCSDHCQRPICVLRRENARLKAELEAEKKCGHEGGHICTPEHTWKKWSDELWADNWKLRTALERIKQLPTNQTAPDCQCSAVVIAMDALSSCA